MLPTVPTTVIVPTFSPVVQMESADSFVLSVRTTTNVDRTSSAVKANVKVVLLLVPVRTTTNVDRVRNAVKANASEVRPLVIVRPTTSLILEGSVVGEFVPHTVVGAAQLLQMLFSARLSSSLSSFPS